MPPGFVMGIGPFFKLSGLRDSGPGFVSSAVTLAICKFTGLWVEMAKTWCKIQLLDCHMECQNSPCILRLVFFVVLLTFSIRRMVQNKVLNFFKSEGKMFNREKDSGNIVPALKL